MKKYGLIGKSLSHSWSPQWFAQTFAQLGIRDAEYRLYEMETVDNLLSWAAINRMDGFNVTIPFKEAVIPYMDTLDAVARSIGAVNCVECRGGCLIGHNTDAPAFARTLQPLLRPWHTRALVLGTGGASKAVAYALQSMGIDLTFVSRTPGRHPAAVSYSEASQLAATHLLIVNATPVGMSALAGQSPWPCPQLLTPRHLCYDLIYNPSPTAFLLQASRAGATVCDGLPMLHAQAELSWQCWSRPAAPAEPFHQ